MKRLWFALLVVLALATPAPAYNLFINGVETINAGSLLAVADGGTGASTAQAAIDALTAVAAATNEHVLTKDTVTGNAIFKASSPSVSREMIINLKPVVNAAVNKLDIFTKSGGAVPDATNPIKVMIPDGNGYTQRTRAAAYLSGTSQFIMADAANYWSKGSLNAEIKTAYVYAIWDGTGIVWALGGYSGFTRVPASTTATDDDFFLLEASSTYTKVITDYCVCVGKIRYEYDTAGAPDHTIQATVLDAPQVMWNPKSDYGYQKNLATTVTSASDISEVSHIEVVVKQSGKYLIIEQVVGNCTSGTLFLVGRMKTGSSTYASAVVKAVGIQQELTAAYEVSISIQAMTYLNAGDSIHLGILCTGAAGNRIIRGNDYVVGATNITFCRVD